MRIADPEAIRKGEKALAEAIAANFDHGVIRQIFKRVHNLDVGEDIQCKNAALGIHEDEVAYSMDFEVLVNLSVFLDRTGNFISVTSSGVAGEAPTQNAEPTVASPEKAHAPETESQEGTDVEVGENDVVEGSYEAVLKEFAPIDSESQESNL
jgi:hypothetical protein